MDDLWLEDVDQLRVCDMKKMLKEVGSFYCLQNRDEYVKKVNAFKDNISFKWRKDQKEVLTNFLKFKHETYVVHAVFGSGKTTLLLGLLIRGIMNKLFKPEDIMFISFNVSIKNEIKRKLKGYGISNKVSVRTFDSIVYEICKMGKYPYLDLPNFEGKRKFAYDMCYNKKEDYKIEYQPKVIFIDECQDLEMHTLIILKHFYKEARFVFAGDIFQSIQKEPRESILWHFMNLPEDKKIYKIYMSETPRVPKSTLNTIKKALKVYYPEFKDKINNWKSGNKVSNADIEWKRLNSYTHIFEDLKEFLSCHKPEETMILTFSAAITVRGAMGDIARIRKFLGENGIKVNNDHKKLDPDTFFLSTANSSKGLERDYVIIFLTFPLERAFVHLSNDVVVNLITVALTRAKKKVIMYVPSYEDKYSQVLSIFETCPAPNKKRLREGKTLKEFGFQDYIDMEHCVTELIRVGIIKYDTRIRLREHTKVFNFGKIFDENINYKTAPIVTEEDRMFVGVLIENLITSTWTGKWPKIECDDTIKQNPMYMHIIKRVSKNIDKYRSYRKSNKFSDANQFEGIYMYSQIHMAISNKLFMRLSDTLSDNLKKYWKRLKPKAHLIKPNAKELKIQAPVKMALLTGIADSIALDDDGKTTSLVEIKASQMQEWKDDALLQVSCYALMTGKSWTRLHLFNPFRNEKVSYYFDTKNILSLRKELSNDILVWNTNAMMAKLYPQTKGKSKMKITETMFLNLVEDKDGNVTQASLINMISPIKCEIVYNKYVTSGLKKKKDMNKEERFACESDMTEERLLRQVNRILKKNVNKKKIVWSFDKYEKIKKETKIIKDFYNLKDFEEVIKFLDYNKEKTENYTIDFNDSFVRNIFSMSFMFLNNNFI